jgi:ABC-type branched-subunit amino acid transport system substrate-binding protein
MDAYASTGQPYFCRQSDHQCKQLTNDGCTRVLHDDVTVNADGTLGAARKNDELRNDKTIFLGAIMPLTGANGPAQGIIELNILDIVRNDFNGNLGGIPNPGGGSRPVAWVVCDEQRTGTGTDDTNAALTHLITDLQVPALLGPAFSADVVFAATAAANPAPKANVLLVTGTGQTSALTTIAANSTTDPVGTRLLYRTCPRDVQGASLIAQSVKDYWETALESASGTVPSGQPMRVMLVNAGDTFGKSFAQGVIATLTFNGKSVADNLAAGNFKQHDFGNITAPDSPEAQSAFASANEELVAFKPHIAIVVGRGEGGVKIMLPAEKLWTETAFRPIWLGGPGFASDSKFNSGVDQAVKDGNTNLRSRIQSVNPGSNDNDVYKNELYPRYVSALAQGGPALNYFGVEQYDGVYSLYFALIANGAAPLTGPKIAAAMSKLVPGTGRQAFKLGSKNVGAIANILAGGGSVDLQGAIGPIDFNLTNGDVITDYGTVCVGTKADGTTTLGNAGYTFDAVQNKYVGVPDLKGCKP